MYYIQKWQPYDSESLLETLKESRVSDHVSLIRELILLETGSADLMKKLWFSHRANFWKDYLIPAQKYRQTDSGKRCIQMPDSP
jgi:hypothetical protein